MLTVADTGVGMDERTKEHIFEPFFTTKGIGKGTGLGLASVYGITKNHEGYIYCYSEPDLGTKFQIYLPVYQAEALEPSSAMTSPGQTFDGHERILLVDDEKAWLELGPHFLRSKGYRVWTAQSGEEALEIYHAKGSAVDLVILDLGMPGMGGRKALKEILAINPNAKVIIASGYLADDLVNVSPRLGAAAYVVKPFRRTELLTTVRRVLDKKAAEV